MTWGRNLEFLRDMQAEGLHVKALDSFPKLDERLVYVFKVFNILDRSRQIGMHGPQAITVEAFFAYCQMVGIQNTETRLALLVRVQCLDSTKLSFDPGDTGKQKVAANDI